MEWLALTEEHPKGEVWEHCQTIARNLIRAVKEDRLMELLYRGKMHLSIKFTYFCLAMA